MIFLYNCIKIAFFLVAKIFYSFIICMFPFSLTPWFRALRLQNRFEQMAAGTRCSLIIVFFSKILRYILCSRINISIYLNSGFRYCQCVYIELHAWLLDGRSIATELRKITTF